MKYNYKVNIDLSDRNTSWSQILNLVGANKRVLDIGCATGHLTKYFTANNCSVVGVEIDEEFALEAKQYCEEMVVGDIQQDSTIDKINGKFDAIVFGDTLEHLSCPENALNKTRYLLKEDGYLVISLPNIALWRIRFLLLFGKFDYSDRGIMDRTHLRFFTLKTAKKLLSESGYKCLSIDYRFDFPFYSRSLARHTIYLGGFLTSFLKRFYPTLFAMQFIFSAKPYEAYENH